MPYFLKVQYGKITVCFDCGHVTDLFRYGFFECNIEMGLKESLSIALEV